MECVDRKLFRWPEFEGLGSASLYLGNGRFDCRCLFGSTIKTLPEPTSFPMRLTESQTQAIRQITRQLAGEDARVRVFGSRLDDSARGGDLDLLLELPEAAENAALLVARLSVQVSRLMHGRKVDVVLSAPNLMHLPIHDVALREGRLL